MFELPEFVTLAKQINETLTGTRCNTWVARAMTARAASNRRQGSRALRKSPRICCGCATTNWQVSGREVKSKTTAQPPPTQTARRLRVASRLCRGISPMEG